MLNLAKAKLTCYPVCFSNFPWQCSLDPNGQRSLDDEICCRSRTDHNSLSSLDAGKFTQTNTS